MARETVGNRRELTLDEVLDLFPALRGLLAAGRVPVGWAAATAGRSRGRWSPSRGCCGWLQPSIVHEIEEAIGQLHAFGLTILLVGQYLELALRIADRFVILDVGEVVRAGNAEDLRDESVRGLLAV